MANITKVDNTAVGEEFIIEDDGKYYIKHTQRGDTIRAILDQNEFERNQGNNGYGASRELKKIASIPIMMDYEFCKIYGKEYAKDKRIIQRILSEYPYLRTS